MKTKYKLLIYKKNKTRPALNIELYDIDPVNFINDLYKQLSQPSNYLYIRPQVILEKSGIEKIIIS